MCNRHYFGNKEITCTYNGEPFKEGEKPVPFILSRGLQQDLRESTECNSININKRNIAFAAIEEHKYDAYMSFYHGIENEEIDKTRKGRCILGYNRKTGGPILCPKENRCRQCKDPDKYNYDRLKANNNIKQPASLDYMFNECGFDYEDTGRRDPCDAVIDKIMFEELMEGLRDINPRYETIAMMSFMGYEKNEIIAAIGLKSSQGYAEIKKAYELAVKLLGIE